MLRNSSSSSTVPQLNGSNVMVIKNTGCKPITSFKPPISQSVFTAQQVLSQAVDEERSTILNAEKNIRIREM